MHYEIRELGVGGILDQAIAVTKDHFWLFVKIVAVFFLPSSTLSHGWAVASTVAGAQADDMSIGNLGHRRDSPGWASLNALIALIVYPLTNAAMIYAVASCYLDRPITLGLAFQRAGSVFLPLLGTVALLWLVLLAGMLLLVVPFFIFLFWFFLTVQDCGVGGTERPGGHEPQSRVDEGETSAPQSCSAILVWVISAAVGGHAGFYPAN